jgi:hypothetical protein
LPAARIIERNRLQNPACLAANMTKTLLNRRQFSGGLAASALSLVPLPGADARDAPTPRVEIEEPVYEFTPPDNGAGPLWAYGAPGLVRRGNTVFAAGLETIPGVKPLNNCRWVLYRRGAGGWERVLADEMGRQREPDRKSTRLNSSHHG